MADHNFIMNHINERIGALIMTMTMTKIGMTFDELNKTLAIIESQKVDYICPASGITMNVPDATKTEFTVNINNGNSTISDVHMSGVFLNQLAQYANIPVSYCERLMKEDPYLLQANINRRMATSNPTKNRMIRVLNNGDGGGLARALLSPRYKIIDNKFIMDNLSRYIDDKRLNPNGGTLQIANCNISKSSRLDVKLVSPRLQGDVVPGDTVQFGVSISNSEIGFGRAVVTPFIYRLVCSNGMIAERQIETMNKKHIGKANQVDEDDMTIIDAEYQEMVRNEIADLMHRSVQFYLSGNRFEQYIDIMRDSRARALPNGNHQYLITNMAKDLNFSVGEKELAYKHFETEADWTIYGLANSVTRTARDINYERAAQLEAMGWDLLNTSDRVINRWFDEPDNFTAINIDQIISEVISEPIDVEAVEIA